MQNKRLSTEWLGWMMVLMGALLALVAGRQVAGLLAQNDGWTSVPATVQRTRVVQTPGMNQISGATQSHPRPVRVVQEVVYFLQGRRFQATLDLGVFEDRAAAIAAARQAETAGSSIDVWVDPQQLSVFRSKPSRRKTADGATVLYGFLGLLALPLGASLLRNLTRRQRPRTGSAQPHPLPTH
jgi:hypothetical protein